MSRMQDTRTDSSAGAMIDLSPAVIAARVKRLAIVRRTAKAAAHPRAAIAKKYGRTAS